MAVMLLRAWGIHSGGVKLNLKKGAINAMQLQHNAVSVYIYKPAPNRPRFAKVVLVGDVGIEQVCH
jgi:hypothetical protein